MSLTGCGEAATDTPEDETCADGAAPACDALYAPTFDDLYARRLSVSCATSSVCHGSGTQVDLVLDDADSAWEALVEGGRVLPGHPNCGMLIDRLTTSDPARRMPRGGTLSAAELCAVQQWIAAGAPR